MTSFILFVVTTNAYALLPLLEFRVLACVRFESQKAILTKESEQTITNLLLLLERSPQGFHSLSVKQSSGNTLPHLPSNLALLQAIEREKVLLDALLKSDKQDSIFSDANIDFHIYQSSRGGSLCDAEITAKYEPQAAAIFCGPKSPSYCNYTRCDYDGCKSP